MRLLLISFLFSTSLLANPFSQFVGVYDVSGDVYIEKSNDNMYCNWMDFENIVAAEILEDEEGELFYRQFSSQNDLVTTQPLEEFREDVEQISGISFYSYSENMGDLSFAQNTRSTTHTTTDKSIIRIEKTEDAYVLKMESQFIWRAVLSSYCLYSVPLEKR